MSRSSSGSQFALDVGRWMFDVGCSRRQAAGIGVGADEGGKLDDAGERGAGLLAVADFDAEFLLKFHHELEGVDGVEVEAGADKRLVVGDVFGPDVVELERIDDQNFEAGGERVGHAMGGRKCGAARRGAASTLFQPPTPNIQRPTSNV
jgi:hypothetical protein